MYRSPKRLTECLSFQSISHVSVIIRQAYPLSRQLDQDAGEMVLHKIEAMGVQVLTSCSPTEQLTRLADDKSGDEIFTGLQLQDGTIHNANLVIYAIGIKPRDELAKAAGIECHPRGGVVVSDNLQTSVQDVYAIGECASWKGNFYGLIAPGSKLLYFLPLPYISLFSLLLVEMADILSFNLTQTESHAPRIMNTLDLSTKLK